MRCERCNSDNPEATKFCIECGTALKRHCQKCGFDNFARAKFCGECGVALIESSKPETDALETEHERSTYAEIQTREGPNGERRHLTVLFCDLVGSTGISSRLDPEEWREALAGYHRTAAQEITRFGGHVAKYLGDGVMALFGYPQAHENDAECAVRAGLTILEAVSRLEAPVKLSARVGIDSGPVVVGAGADKEADVFGDAPNIAARVQAAAEPGTLAITEATQRLVSGLFVVEERGAEPLKGIEQPVKLYRVAGSSGVRGRLEAGAAVRGMTPFVGREDELRTLTNRWERVCEGEGQVATIIGEAGIGKSRLVQRFRERIAADSHTWLECATAPFFQNTPFYAVAEMLEQSLQWEHRFAALEASLKGLSAGTTATSSALSDTASRPASALSPEEERKRLLARLVEWALETSRNQPLVIVIEDLHWADPSTLELIQLLVEQGTTSRLLLLYTARPEFRAQWPLRAHHTQITLNRLVARNVRTMIEEVAARKALADDTVAALVERTGGVPLFVEELTRAVLEGGTSLAGHEIPATLHDSLMARLDRLGPAKEVAQIGAVIGSEFSHELLQAVYPLERAELDGRLRALADAELIHVRGIAPNATYRFKHALIRDAAYEALLKSRRKELHLRVARAIDEKFPAIKETQPEVLAHHCTEAGLPERAIPYWQRAGQQASNRSANVEAIRYFTIGIELLKKTPDSLERAQTELALQTALGAPLQTLKGPGDSSVASVYDRAQELCQQIGDTPYLFPTLFGLWRFYLQRTEMQRVRELAERLLNLAQQQQDASLLMEAHRVLATTLFFIPDFVAAKTHSEQAIALYDKELESARATLFPNPPGVVCRLMLSHILWIWGYADQALEQCYEALSLARKLSQPASLVYALAWTSMLHQFRQEPNEAQGLVEEELTLLTERGLDLWRGPAAIVQQWALAMQGRQAGVIEAIHKGLAAYRACGAENMRPYNLSMLAEVGAVTGQITEGQSAISEAITGVENSGLRYFEAELHRLKGELLLRSAVDELQVYAQEEAETCFYRAIDIAQRQNAKSWELRATTSLARLLRDSGRREEGRAMLATIYGWFTEGFDTKDLIEAKALLEELSL